jgi:tetratricopeptide (TPR) repeat protein
MKISAASICISAAVLAVSTAAYAGDEPLYAPAPEWAEPTTINAETRENSSPIVLLGQQARIEKGRLWTYSEFVVALDSPEALNRFGTLQAQWLPDKGDLIIHEAVLLRDGKEVSLIEGDQKFEVLRRERRLESRMLDGQLTATMPVAGAQIGDLVRLTYSVTLSDQAMGDDVQWQAGIFTKPFPLGDGYISVSWPKDMPVSTGTVGNPDIDPPELNGDHMEWKVFMPLPEQDDKPRNAPLRYLLPPAMQVTTYTDWQAVSRSMAPHYDVTGTIPAGSELAKEVARIKASSSNPRDQLAASLEMVQEQVSYLLNGLNGGNYLPQMPADTWEKRYGDCKAKSVLLHAILQQLGITSEVVLVRTRAGDALPELAPMPGNFDHMIVRAEVDGETFWLDGTGTGQRADTMTKVPRFFYALPVRQAGADLMAMKERPLTVPDRWVKLSIDSRAGIKVPALFDVAVEYSGAQGSRWRAVAEQTDLDQQENAVDGAVASLIGGAQVTDYTVTYDVERGLGKVTAKGLMASSFDRERAIYEMVAPTQPARNVSFNADRARKAWRDVPMRLNGPNYFKTDLEILLPDEASQFAVKGRLNVDEVIGGVEVKSDGMLAGNRFTLSQSTRSLQAELPADQITDAKRAITRLKRALPKIQSGREFRREWDYLGKNAKALAPIKAAFDKIVAGAKDDDELAGALKDRAEFRKETYDFLGALADVNAAIDLKRSTSLLWSRAELLRSTGDLAGSLADYEEIESLEPNGRSYDKQVELLALLGRKEDALALAEDFRGLGKNEMQEDIVMASAMGWAGNGAEGLQVLEDRRAVRPGDGRLLNAICWHAGTWDIVTDAEVATCVEAVEHAQYSAGALDSRALVYYRMGELDKAKADLDAALLLDPGLAASRLLRGFVRKAQGDKKGKDDIELALRIDPALKDTYEAWGFKL